MGKKYISTRKGQMKLPHGISTMKLWPKGLIEAFGIASKMVLNKINDQFKQLCHP